MFIMYLKQFYNNNWSLYLIIIVFTRLDNYYKMEFFPNDLHWYNIIYTIYNIYYQYIENDKT